eukprot:235625-Lingulodinium_polyedra.AAC.1
MRGMAGLTCSRHSGPKGCVADKAGSVQTVEWMSASRTNTLLSASRRSSRRKLQSWARRRQAL